jgi:L-ascorbate metabolism protein UlaG (beta-lactamase superfamily)
MKIRYLGHSAFELTLESGAKVVCDPYEAGSFGGALAYDPIKGEFDLAVVSHEHDDHRSKAVLSRSKNVVRSAGRHEAAGIVVESIASYHDDRRGSERGKNLISVIEADGMRIAHLGDLGHSISIKDYPLLKGVDVLMIPVGGHYTIDAATASAVAKALAPKVVIPMHYKTGKVDFPITTVENFTKLMDTVKKVGGSELVVTKATLPDKLTVVVLDPAN